MESGLFCYDYVKPYPLKFKVSQKDHRLELNNKQAIQQKLYPALKGRLILCKCRNSCVEEKFNEPQTFFGN